MEVVYLSIYFSGPSKSTNNYLTFALFVFLWNSFLNRVKQEDGIPDKNEKRCNDAHIVFGWVGRKLVFWVKLVKHVSYINKQGKRKFEKLFNKESKAKWINHEKHHFLLDLSTSFPFWKEASSYKPKNSIKYRKNEELCSIQNKHDSQHDDCILKDISRILVDFAHEEGCEFKSFKAKIGDPFFGN